MHWRPGMVSHSDADAPTCVYDIDTHISVVHATLKIHTRVNSRVTPDSWKEALLQKLEACTEASAQDVSWCSKQFPEGGLATSH
jgi:hypothetical protein